MATRYYALVQWAPEDVLELRPGWTTDQAEAWLQSNERTIRDRLTERGYAIIEHLLVMEPVPED